MIIVSVDEITNNFKNAKTFTIEHEIKDFNFDNEFLVINTQILFGKK
jgi:hypothetical protein